jgi:hypothetical protein
MWNPFKKTKNAISSTAVNMMQKVAMKKMQNMSQGEREKMMKDIMKPENRDKLLKTMEKMAGSGQVSQHQIEEAKKRLGL